MPFSPAEIRPRIVDLAFRVGPRLGAAALILLAFALAAVIARRLIGRLGRHLSIERRQVLEFLGNAASVALLAWGAITALGTLGVNVSALVASLGLTGFALGFAFKDALSNLLAGMLVLLYRPFQIDDRIAVAGVEGQVRSIDFRFTTLAGEDKRWLVPNSVLLNSTVTIHERAAAAPVRADHQATPLQEAARAS